MKFVATVLTVYGIETHPKVGTFILCLSLKVATVLTVYGIETTAIVNTANFFISRNSTYRLRYWNFAIYINLDWWYVSVATVLTVYGIETCWKLYSLQLRNERRNSTYRLRYWNQPNTVAILHLQLESRNSTYRLRYWNSS